MMPKNKSDVPELLALEGTPPQIAAQIRLFLKTSGSAERARGVQKFFQDEVRSHGWYTADLRRAARNFRREIRGQRGFDLLIAVADQLFSSSVLEEKITAVFLLEGLDAEFGNREFNIFESWLSRIISWSDHDSLVHDLIGPMVVAKPSRAKFVFRWAKSENRWHRRAACVALIRGTRRKLFLEEVKKLSALLLSDEDDMVQKGLGWLLREAAKYNREPTVLYLTSIRDRAPRLVLRTACETVPAELRKQILSAAHVPKASARSRGRTSSLIR